MGMDIGGDKERERAKSERKIVKAKKTAARKEKIKAGMAGFKEGYKGTSHVCTVCGIVARPKRYAPGSFFIEILAWLFFIIPGVCYSLWRHSAKYKGCPDCAAKTMVSIKSPMGQKLTAA